MHLVRFPQITVCFDATDSRVTDRKRKVHDISSSHRVFFEPGHEEAHLKLFKWLAVERPHYCVVPRLNLDEMGMWSE